MKAAITLHPDEFILRDCLIVVFGKHDALFWRSTDAPAIKMENIDFMGCVPSLWGWIKLWWRYRAVRKAQLATARKPAGLVFKAPHHQPTPRRDDDGGEGSAVGGSVQCAARVPNGAPSRYTGKAER
ncbi:hypothetical protein GG804_25155 [Sphingomonas histidinilytica]|uniref:hypothetical protein n=1 Tax=Rhizorhabdus histidinilytica TaxID=439228 RepID=UPI001ADD4708|nr:hypothetical protein [Rhizorhabdus histidinilytica]MBO9380061.1 hypothetical protein [Rhizorhabdus histidinilytica]